MKKLRLNTKPVAFTLSLAISQLLVAPAVFAQAKPATPAGAIEEIIVTAQKRAENLQDVPISIQALSTKDLEKHGIVSLGDLGAEVPGLSLAPYPGSSEIFYPTFRGITTNAIFVSQGNPIAIHMDGVYMSQLVGLNNPAADLERIEILKGPQGVMSGRNATGGAINIHTARPELGQFGFKQQFTLAERGQFLSKTVVNLPVNDDLAVKIAYLHDQKDHDGISNSAPGGVQFGQRDADSWRLDARWKASNAVTVDYAYDHMESKGYDTPPQCLSASPTIVALAAAGSTEMAKFVAGCSWNKQNSLSIPVYYAKNDNKTEGHTLNINWDVSPTLTFKSITGYRKVDTSNHFNYGAYAGGSSVRSDSLPLTVTGVGGFQLGNPIKLFNEAWSQEFQFLGEIDKNLKYTSGVYFSSEKGHQSSGPNIGMYVPDAGGALGVDLLMIDDKGLKSSSSKSTAIFGQLNWTPNILEQKLEIVPGLRYTRDHRQAVGYNNGWNIPYGVVPLSSSTAALAWTGAPNGVGFAAASGDRSWSKMTPAIAFNYHWEKNLMSYLKYATAYTSGGFDPVAGPATAAGFTKGFDPETIKSLEIGMKGEFFERRLRTNIALFTSKFSNEQKSVNNGMNGWSTVNVGGSTYNGLEFDVIGAVTENLRVGFNYATLHHKYDQWIDPSTNTDVTSQRRLIVPKNDYTVNVDYRFPNFGLPGKLDGNLNYTHRDRVSQPLNLSLANIEKNSTAPAFGIWNARIALSQIKAGPDNKGRITVALWGKNLGDKQYQTIVNPGWVSAASGNWGEPRTIGMDLIYNY